MKRTSYANRGKILESLIERANLKYKNQGKALIQKVPIPITISKLIGNKVVGFKSGASTVDFIGVYEGVAIAFDAKETKGKSLPLKNIKDHQINFMLNHVECGGQAFLIVMFTDQNITFKADIKSLDEYIQSVDRKSIPLKWFEENAKKVNIMNYLD